MTGVRFDSLCLLNERYEAMCRWGEKNSQHAVFHVKRRATRGDLDEGNLMMHTCEFRDERAPRVEVVPLPRVERFTWNMPDVRMSDHPHN